MDLNIFVLNLLRTYTRRNADSQRIKLLKSAHRASPAAAAVRRCKPMLRFFSCFRTCLAALLLLTATSKTSKTRRIRPSRDRLRAPSATHYRRWNLNADDMSYLLGVVRSPWHLSLMQALLRHVLASPVGCSSHFHCLNLRQIIITF